MKTALISVCFPDHHLKDVWDYSPNIEKRNHYVGLTNLGATCYMNSITQQFFMDVNFRKGILAAQPFPEKADSQSSDKDDDLLYQLQIIFSNLQESERKAFNAYQFTRAYKDYDGQSMNPYVQMDVDEYFNMLFDKLETKLKGTPQVMEQLFSSFLFPEFNDAMIVGKSSEKSLRRNLTSSNQEPRM